MTSHPRLGTFKRSEIDEWVPPAKAADARQKSTTNEVTEEMAKKVRATTSNGRTRRPERDVVCVDLFCGAGGLTHGLLDAGVRVVAGVDSDEVCKHPYEANHEGVAFHRYDVAELNGSQVEEWFGDATVRVLAGCAPCQPFSSYSHRYDTVGTERWRLLNYFGRLVEEITPDLVTMENVPSVTKHAVFDDFVATLEGQGYDVWYDVIDCAEYGLPQRRRRTVLLASLHGEIELRAPNASEIKTVEDVLKGLPVLRHGGCDDEDSLHTSASLSQLNLERIKASKPGGSWRDWPKHLVAECHRKNTGKKYPSVYGRMRWDEPAPTLTTQFYGFGSGRFGHPSQARGLSLREGAILQGFPEGYSFVPKGEPIQFKVLGRLIGNAVPRWLYVQFSSSVEMRHVTSVQPSSLITSRRRCPSSTT